MSENIGETFGQSPMGEELKPCQCGWYEIEIWDLDMPEGADPGEYVQYVGTNCTRTTTREFAPGHDARLKSLLIRAGARDYGVAHHSGGVLKVGTAESVADGYGFAHQVVAGIERAKARAEAKVAKKAAKSAAKAQLADIAAEGKALATAALAKKAAKKAEADAARPAAPATSTMQIKVGAHVYEAVVDNATQEATYTTKSGQTKTVAESKWSVATK